MQALDAKGRTLDLESAPVPAFGPMPLDRITHASVTRWFDEYSQTAPGRGQSRLERASPNTQPRGPLRSSRHEPSPRHQAQPPSEAHPLSVARGSPPTSSRARPARHRATSYARQADIIRLLLLTGCRRGEIVSPALAGLGRQHAQSGRRQGRTEKGVPERASPSHPGAAAASGERLALSSPLDSGRPVSPHLPLWYMVRREAGFEDVRNPRPQAHLCFATSSIGCIKLLNTL